MNHKQRNKLGRLKNKLRWLLLSSSTRTATAIIEPEDVEAIFSSRPPSRVVIARSLDADIDNILIQILGLSANIKFLSASQLNKLLNLDWQASYPVSPLVALSKV